MQQPVRQYQPGRQSAAQGTPHPCAPVSHVGTTHAPPEPPLSAAPPVDVVPPFDAPPLLDAPPAPVEPPVPVFVQSAGSSVLPMQSSQCPQVFSHVELGVHTGHLLGSSMSAYVHVEAISTWVTLPSGFVMAQQPKQSHPFGVRGSQNFRH